MTALFVGVGIVLSLLLLFALGVVYLVRMVFAGHFHRARIKYAVGFVAVALVAATQLSTGLVRSTEKSKWYGIPLPVGVWEKNRIGKWHDFASSLSPAFAAANAVFWVGTAIPFVILILRRKKRQ